MGASRPRFLSVGAARELKEYGELLQVASGMPCFVPAGAGSHPEERYRKVRSLPQGFLTTYPLGKSPLEWRSLRASPDVPLPRPRPVYSSDPLSASSMCSTVTSDASTLTRNTVLNVIGSGRLSAKTDNETSASRAWLAST